MNEKIHIVHRLKAEGRSERDIAEAVGLSKTRVRQLLAEPAPAAPVGLSTRLVELGSQMSTAGMAAESALLFEAASKIGALEVAAEPTPEDEPDAAPLPTESLEVLRAAMLNAQRDHETWQSLGNSSAANRALRTIAMLVPHLARLERAAREGDGMQHISVAEIRAGVMSNRAKIEKLAQTPNVCPRCHAEMVRAELEAV